MIEFVISLKFGPQLLRPMVKRMTAKGLDVRRCYQLAVAIKQETRKDNGYPPMKVPTWKELDPNSPM